MPRSDAKKPDVTKRGMARKYWSPKERLPVVADVLSGKRNYLDACRHYGAQSNQVYAWAGQAILTERPEALQAIASNSDLMGRLDSLRSAGVRSVAPRHIDERSERTEDRQLIGRLLRALERESTGGVDPVQVQNVLRGMLDRR